MFTETSRYFLLQTSSVVLPDGRTATYTRRRIVPQPGTLQQLGVVTVGQGERIDLVTARTLGDPEQFWRICDANTALDPNDLAVPGRLLVIPIPQS